MASGAEPTGALIGQLIDDRYRIRRLIGRGGMGAVYEAEATRLDRLCAFKALLPEYTRNDTAVQRFRREAQVAARVKHPNVVEIFDTGTTQGGLGYIAMELLQGESLDRTLRREKRLPWPRACHIALQICRALGAAHAKHIVHRDMKPENCFRLTVEGDHDYIKVLDFGIAKLTDPDGDANNRLTATNSVIGTYAYMAFEQVSGLDCDHRVDIWAVGVMLYEMLTGTLPFKGSNQGQIWTAIFQHTPPPVRDIVPDADIPEAVDAIVARALAKNREDRYPAIEALALDLAAVGVTGTAPGLNTLGGFKYTGKLTFPPPAPASNIDPAGLTVAGTPDDSPTSRPTIRRTERVDPHELTELPQGDLADHIVRTQLAPSTDPAHRTELAPTTDPATRTEIAPAPERHPTVQGPGDADLVAPPPPRRRLALLAVAAALPFAAVAAVLLTREPAATDTPAAPIVAATPPPPTTPVVVADPEPKKTTPPVDDPPVIVDDPPAVPIDPPPTKTPTTPPPPTKKTKTPPVPKPPKSFHTKIPGELAALRQSATMRECFTANDGASKPATLAITISAETGKAIDVTLGGLIRGTGLYKCVDRTVRNYQFSKGAAGESNYTTRGFALNK